MTKIFIIIFTLFSFNAFAVDKNTTFSIEAFNKAQSDGKIVVINSWNKTCYTCAQQVKILDQAEKKFNEVLFLSFDQENEIEIANKLNIQYWTTIIIYKGNKEVYRSIGETDKNKILSVIKSL